MGPESRPDKVVLGIESDQLNACFHWTEPGRSFINLHSIAKFSPRLMFKLTIIQLAELLSMCNRVVRVYQQPGLYLTDGFGNARDGFHVSIGWSLTEPPEQLRRDIATAQAALVSDISGLRMSCGALKVKIGNVVHALELGAATD